MSDWQEQDFRTHEREFAAYDIDLLSWQQPKPHGLSGCFRVRDEQEFLELAVASHAAYLDEIVLVIQPGRDGTDRTMEVALRLQRKDRRIKIWRYPFDVYPVGGKDYILAPANSVHSMVYFTNWALSRCSYSWIAKTEADVIALPTFAKCREAIDAEPDRTAYYGRIGLNVAGAGNEIAANAPRNGGWDEAVFNNSPFWHALKADKWEIVNMHDHPELLHNLGWSFLHTKRCKAKHQRLRQHETWVPYTRPEVEKAVQAWNQTHPHPGPDPEVPDVLFQSELRPPDSAFDRWDIVLREETNA